MVGLRAKQRKSSSQSFQQLIVVGVCSDPEPRYRIAITVAYHAVVSCNAYRPRALPGLDALEMKARVPIVLLQEIQRLRYTLCDLIGHAAEVFGKPVLET